MRDSHARKHDVAWAVAVAGVAGLLWWAISAQIGSSALAGPSIAAQAASAATHWRDGSLAVRVVTDPGTGCQYLAFWDANRGAIAVVPRRRPVGYSARPVCR